MFAFQKDNLLSQCDLLQKKTQNKLKLKKHFFNMGIYIHLSNVRIYTTSDK
jgi:hypothetical protein